MTNTPEPHLTKWDYWILRVIAIYHLAKALLFFALGFGLLKLIHADLEHALRVYVVEPMKWDSESPALQWLFEAAANFTPHSIRILSYLVFTYGLIFLIEGIGLYLQKRWAEWMVVIVVSSLLPFEGWAMYHHFVWWKVALTIGNLLVVGFLIRQIMMGKPKKH